LLIRNPLVIVGIAVLLACTQSANRPADELAEKPIGELTETELKALGILAGTERDQFNEKVRAGFAFALLATCSTPDTLPLLVIEDESGKSLRIESPGPSTLVHIRPGIYRTLYAGRRSQFSELAARSITFLGPCKEIPDWLTTEYLYEIVRLPLIWGAGAPR
jgi:hypothetical protein